MTLRRALLGLGVLGAVYFRFLRKPILTWGATAEEARATLPGDELLENADGVATRAIDVDAPPSAVWPWLAQMGPAPRGGAYTYDWIENLLGLDMHSVERVLPEFQHPQVGDTIGLGANRMRYERVEPERVLSSRSEDGNWVWTFVLEERSDSTRLISRNRFRLPPSLHASGCSRWSPPRSSWSGRCSWASTTAPCVSSARPETHPSAAVPRITCAVSSGTSSWGRCPTPSSSTQSASGNRSR